MKRVGVGEGVRVTEGVAVGMSGVTVGVSVGVRVGAVDVGNGPRSETEVIASAVFVPSALSCAPNSPPVRRKANTESSRINPIPKRDPRRSCKGARCSLKLKFIGLALFLTLCFEGCRDGSVSYIG